VAGVDVVRVDASVTEVPDQERAVHVDAGAAQEINRRCESARLDTS